MNWKKIWLAVRDVSVATAGSIVGVDLGNTKITVAAVAFALISQIAQYVEKGKK